jgi:MoaA/NifB/PqqE/SkfB family radical SAM enzyme
MHCVVQVSREKAIQKSIPDMSTDESIKAIQIAIQNGATKIVLSGGEPTVRHDIVELVDLILKQDVQVQIQTNGINTNSIKDILDLACRKTKKNLLEFMIPLHGNNPKVHEKVNNNKGSLRATLSSLEIISENNIAIIGKIVCTRYGGQDIVQISNLYLQYKARAIIIAYPHCVWFSDDLVLGTDLKKEETTKLFQELDKVSFEIPIYLQGFPHCFTGSLQNKNILFQEEMPDFLNTKNIENKQRDWIGIPWHEYRRKEKTKFKHCGTCSYFTGCEGIWSEYIRVYGQ